MEYRVAEIKHATREVVYDARRRGAQVKYCEAYSIYDEGC